MEETKIPMPTGEDQAQAEPVVAEGEGKAQDAEPVFEIDGQKYTLTEIRRWRDTRPNLEKYYYTKLNELARREREVQDAVVLYEFLRQRPDVAQRLAEFVEAGGQVPSQMPGETTDEYLARLEKLDKRLQGLEGHLQEERARRLQEEADRALADEIRRLKDRYGNDPILPFNEEQVLLEAYNSGVLDLETVYKKLRGDALDLEKLKQRIIKEYLDQKRASSVPPAPPRSGGVVGPSGGPPRTLAEARRSALQRLLGRREGE